MTRVGPVVTSMLLLLAALVWPALSVAIPIVSVEVVEADAIYTYTYTITGTHSAPEMYLDSFAIKISDVLTQPCCIPNILELPEGWGAVPATGLFLPSAPFPPAGLIKFGDDSPNTSIILDGDSIFTIAFTAPSPPRLSWYAIHENRIRGEGPPPETWFGEILAPDHDAVPIPPVPEPGTLLLLGAGSAGLIALRRRAR